MPTDWRYGRLRVARRLTRAQLGRKCVPSLSAIAIEGIELGDKVPTEDQIRSICKVLKVDAEIFLPRKEDHT